MSCNNERCGFSACSCIGVVISIVFGAIVGILFAFCFIPFIVTAIWIAFGIGVLALILLVLGVFLGAVTAPNALSKCLCRNTTCLLVGIFGTIISAIAALSIWLIPVCIPVIALVTIAAFFFSLLVIGLIAFISCVVCKMCSLRED